MKQTALTIALISAPALLLAQQTSTGASASASANAQAEVSIPANYSADARGKIDAAFQKARAKHLPEDQMRRRMAEGQAKSASDAQVAAAVQRVETNLEASQALFVRAGKANPQPDEVTSGEQAMERGATDAQIIATIKNPPTNVTAAVALDALAKAGAASEAAAGTVGAAATSVKGGVGAAGAVGGVTGAVSGAVTAAVGAKKP